MRTLLKLYLLTILIAAGIGSPVAAAMSPCAEGYFEGVHLNRVKTQTGFFYGKAGYCSDAVQLGLVTRVGADTRTANDPSSEIYNDNYVFTGVGASLLNVLPGLRLLAEGGYSFDISKKISRKGPDFRGGWMSYNETSLLLSDLKFEFYSEGLYVHRYLNFLTSLQPRLFYGFIKPVEALAIGPLLGANGSYDSAAFTYNRFVELNYGLKGKWFPSNDFSFGAQVYGVRGFQTMKAAPLPSYNDFRVLLFGYFSIK